MSPTTEEVAEGGGFLMEPIGWALRGLPYVAASTRDRRLRAELRCRSSRLAPIITRCLVQVKQKPRSL